MAAISYNIINDGGTIITRLNFVFVTPPEVTLSADLSAIKSGAPSNFSGTSYAITGLNIPPGGNTTFYVNYLYFTGVGGEVYDGSITVTGYSSTGSDSELVSTRINIIGPEPITLIEVVPLFGQYIIEAPASASVSESASSLLIKNINK